jgi:hypothetical protein
MPSKRIPNSGRLIVEPDAQRYLAGLWHVAAADKGHSDSCDGAKA